MIIKYSFLQIKRIVETSKLLFFHTFIFTPGFGIYIYIMRETLNKDISLGTSSIVYVLFLLQSVFIVGKRVKNEFFFSSNCYQIFPQRKMNIYFYTLIFGIIDIQVFLLVCLSFGMFIFAIQLSLFVKIIFFFIFLLGEIAYLIIMMIAIEIMTAKYGNSKNLLIVTFMLPMLIYQFTLISEQFYLFNLYPISGWIWPAVLAAIDGDITQVLFYFGITILTIVIGAFLLHKVSYPKKDNVI